MTEKEFKALLKIEGKRMRVEKYSTRFGLVWYAWATNTDRYKPEEFIAACTIENAPPTRKEAVQMLIKVWYD